MWLLRLRGCLCVRFDDNDDSVLSSSSDILSESRGTARLVERVRVCRMGLFVDNDDSVLSSSSDILSESRGTARLVERARVCWMGLFVCVLVGVSFVVSLYSVLDAFESDNDKDAA